MELDQFYIKELMKNMEKQTGLDPDHDKEIF